LQSRDFISNSSLPVLELVLPPFILAKPSSAISQYFGQKETQLPQPMHFFLSRIIFKVI